MFTMGPPLWGGTETDEYAAMVMALLHFNDAPGTTLPTVSLGAATTSNGATATNQTSAAAAYFDSAGWRSTAANGLDILHVPPDGGAPYTMEFFFRQRTSATLNRFFGAYNTPSGNSFYLAVESGILVYYESGAFSTVSTGAPISLDVWYYVCIQYEAGNQYIDLNGTRVLTSTKGRSVGGTGCTLEINGSGGLGGADAQFDFDEFRWTSGVRRYPVVAPVPTSEFPNS